MPRLPTIECLKSEGDLEIVWLTKFFRDDAGGWRVQGVVHNAVSARLEIFDCPIGMMPWLAPGRVFHKGILSADRLRGERTRIVIDAVGSGTDVMSDEIPEALIEQLPRPPKTRGAQILIRYRCGSMDVYVPKFELIRALFLQTKELSNALMRPQGVMELYQPENPGLRDALHLKFTRKMPVRVLHDRFAEEFAWIFVHPVARKSWDSVQLLSDGVPVIDFYPPKFGPSEWDVLWITAGNAGLVLEIFGLNGKEHPCKILKYSHPSFRGKKLVISSNRRNVSGVGPTPGSRSKEKMVYTVKSTGSTRTDSNQATVNIPGMIGYAFNFRILTGRDIEDGQIRNVAVSSGAELGVGKGGNGGDGRGKAGGLTKSDDDQMVTELKRVVVGVIEPGVDGTVDPIEFKSLPAPDEDYVGELASLMETLKCLGTIAPSVRISVARHALKQGKSISMVQTWRRPYLIAVISAPEMPLQVLIDVDHNAIRSLAMLHLNYFESPSREELAHDIEFLMDGMVGNGGRWENEREENRKDYFDCDRMPCVLRYRGKGNKEEYYSRWAMTLAFRLGLLAFVQ